MKRTNLLLNWEGGGVLAVFFLPTQTVTAQPAPLPDCSQAIFAAPPTSAITTTQDRDQMLCQLGLTRPTLPPRLTDPFKPTWALPTPPPDNPGTCNLDPNDPYCNWTDALGHTITRGTWGL